MATIINGEYFFDSELEARAILKSEGERLEKIAKKVWRAYLATYTPKKYSEHLPDGMAGFRTGRTERGIKLGLVKKLDEDTLGIELIFEDDLMYHPSVFGSKYPKGHSLMLISQGWHVKKGRHMNVERFGYYEGFDYLSKVVEEFNSSKHAGIILQINWSGKFTKR